MFPQRNKQHSAPTVYKQFCHVNAPNLSGVNGSNTPDWDSFRVRTDNGFSIVLDDSSRKVIRIEEDGLYIANFTFFVNAPAGSTQFLNSYLYCVFLNGTVYTSGNHRHVLTFNIAYDGIASTPLIFTAVPGCHVRAEITLDQTQTIVFSGNYGLSILRLGSF